MMNPSDADYAKQLAGPPEDYASREAYLASLRHEKERLAAKDRKREVRSILQVGAKVVPLSGDEVETVVEVEMETGSWMLGNGNAEIRTYPSGWVVTEGADGEKRRRNKEFLFLA